MKPFDDNQYAWDNVFSSAGKPDVVGPHGTISDKNFFVPDVESVVAFLEPDEFGEDFKVLGKLKDGRFFFISAGWDSTYDWGRSYVSLSLEYLKEMILTADERKDMGL